MLVTPRFGGLGWLIPKGNVESGMGSGDSAEKEAFEEAGIVGVRSRRPVGYYSYTKKGRTHRVAVFLLKISKTHSTWLEESQRSRRLFREEAAMKVLKNRRLVKLVRKLPELAAKL